VEVLTDYNNLRGFINVKSLNGRQARWAIKLAAYNFTITHRSSKSNLADTLLRRSNYESENQTLKTLLPTL